MADGGLVGVGDLGLEAAGGAEGTYLWVADQRVIQRDIECGSEGVEVGVRDEPVLQDRVSRGLATPIFREVSDGLCKGGFLT